jgi:hypothetical protein
MKPTVTVSRLGSRIRYVPTLVRFGPPDSDSHR